MVDRRHFMKSAAAAGGMAAMNPAGALAARQAEASGYYGLNEFIEKNPDAVFIMRTNVDVKTNSEAKKNAGLDFGRSVFVPKSEADGGVPISHNVAIKPNLTSRGHWQSKGYTVEGTMGVITDAEFTEGIINSFIELGVSPSDIYSRETNTSEDEMIEGGWRQMADRTGTSLRVNSATVNNSDPDDLVWVDLPDGMWFRKLPYLWPFNAPDTFFLNVAKFKTHGMGVTLCGKNLQGTLCHNYQALCGGYNTNMAMNPAHRNLSALTDIQASYNRLKDSIPRWDKPGTSFDSGIGMETWAHRTIDNHKASNVNLHIVEGVYGRDGGGFTYGPNPNGARDDLALDYMTNIVFFGKNAFNVDSIGHWLGGHEPGNMGYLHIARDRGMGNTLNPFEIPVYEWFPDGTAVRTPLSDFERTPLKTYYLQRNYDGQDEPYWHLMDEPFDYGPVSVDKEEIDTPEAFVLHQNSPNPFNPTTAIEYDIPAAGNVKLEVFNASGQLVDVLVDSHRAPGSHMAVWNTKGHSSGVYFYRLRINGHSATKKMTLLK